ncbi:MAG: hypothetical protein E6F99_15280 [Actinobacteria bacterium]|nr:MAG: hypothetical protein E6F99_15280 [Actinomycetota bacterium]
MDADGGSVCRRRRWPWFCLAAGLAMFHYTVPIGAACVTGYLMSARAASIRNTVYAADPARGCAR